MSTPTSGIDQFKMRRRSRHQPPPPKKPAAGTADGGTREPTQASPAATPPSDPPAAAEPPTTPPSSTRTSPKRTEPKASPEPKAPPAPAVAPGVLNSLLRDAHNAALSYGAAMRKADERATALALEIRQARDNGASSDALTDVINTAAQRGNINKRDVPQAVWQAAGLKPPQRR